jgi:GntR family negative regulator for fad regulon and positive regulator of fabA
MDLMDWEAPLRPAELIEYRLIEAIMDGHFPINSHLPPERELAGQLGVTRPTLREALQRLARDGWIEIQQGKLTRVRNYWEEGSLGVLGSLARNQLPLPSDFIPNLLAIRTLLAPTYTRLAVENAPSDVKKLLRDLCETPDTPEDFAQGDWTLHNRLTILSGNPVFTLILNGFKDLYARMAELYFSRSPSRNRSRTFYQDLLRTIEQDDLQIVEGITKAMMEESQMLWQTASNRIGESI